MPKSSKNEVKTVEVEKKEPPKINEKSLQVLSCAVAVAVMILLMSGDMIITQFIPVRPNQEYPTENTPKEEPIHSNESYDVSFLTPIHLTEILTKIKNKESFIVFSGRETCGPCHQFLPLLKSSMSELNIEKGYYLDRNQKNYTMEEYDEFIAFDPFLEENFGATPLLFVFQDGKYKNGTVGILPQEKDTIESIHKVLKSR